MAIVEMVSFGVVLVFVAALLVLRILPGCYRMIREDQTKKVLTIKSVGEGWGVYDGDELAQNVRVHAGQTVKWTLSTDPLTSTSIQEHLSKKQEQEPFIIELSLPSSVFNGFSKRVEHQALVIPHNVENGNPSISYRVSLFAPPGTYPYAVEVDLDSGTFARGGSHTRVHTDPW